MTNTVFVELVTPEHLFFSEDATSVIVPGVDGDVGVLPEHSPLISTLRPGVVTVENGNNVSQRVVVTEGFAEVTADRCTVLAENAYELDALSVADVERDILALKEDMEKEYRDDALKEQEKKLYTLNRVLDVLKVYK